MQPVARDGLTAEQVRDLIASVNVDVDAGVELLDRQLQTVGEVALEPSGSQVTYTAEQTIPFRYSLMLAEPVDWGTAWLRPYMTLTDGLRSIRVLLGVCRRTLPATDAGEQPALWQVDGYDLTSALDFAHGETVRLAAGDSYLALARGLCESRGLTVQFAGEADSPVAERERVWPLDASTTTLQIVNELLTEAGWRHVWPSPSGVIRSQPARDPADLGAEWVYNAQAAETTVGWSRRRESNRLDVPNRLVGIASAATAWDPVTGDGAHVIDDEASIQAEGLRTVVETLDAHDQTELVAATQRRWAELRRVVDTISLETLPNPLHWVDDVVEVRDTDLDVTVKGLVTSWTLPLDGGQMPVTVESL